jgi:hypothetical protein
LSAEDGADAKDAIETTYRRPEDGDAPASAAAPVGDLAKTRSLACAAASKKQTADRRRAALDRGTSMWTRLL